VTIDRLAPGFVETDMVVAMPETARGAVIERIPVQRLGDPDEIVDAVQVRRDDPPSYVVGFVSRSTAESTGWSTPVGRPHRA
jgi:NAD(P)-dependent dehydrogenase (short-subunit alcohol dehydrogenase family)